MRFVCLSVCLSVQCGGAQQFGRQRGPRCHAADSLGTGGRRGTGIGVRLSLLCSLFYYRSGPTDDLNFLFGISFYPDAFCRCWRALRVAHSSTGARCCILWPSMAVCRRLHRTYRHTTPQRRPHKNTQQRMKWLQTHLLLLLLQALWPGLIRRFLMSLYVLLFVCSSVCVCKPER